MGFELEMLEWLEERVGPEPVSNGTPRAGFQERKPNSRLTLALVVHESRLNNFRRLVAAHKHLLSETRLITNAGAAETMSALGIDSEIAANRPEGSASLIGRLVIRGEVDAVILLPDDTDSAASLSRGMLVLCDAHNVPLAPNLASAEIMLSSPELVPRSPRPARE